MSDQWKFVAISCPVALVLTGIIWALSGHGEPFAGAICCSILFVAFAGVVTWLESD
jgi:hypothetical protein